MEHIYSLKLLVHLATKQLGRKRTCFSSKHSPGCRGDYPPVVALSLAHPNLHLKFGQETNMSAGAVLENTT